ncbi:MAG TPA: hypothetical protein VGU66_06625 [Candidatus Elarobacter sp.]|nr:hypothetical protein [Candidatus Elarobacter sp.]
MDVHNITLVSTEVPMEMLSRFAATLQVQIMRDFAPFWNVGAAVAAVSNIADVGRGAAPIFISRIFDGPNEGVHKNPSGGLPMANVKLDDKWTVTTSHEALEMLADPSCNRPFLAPSIDPEHAGEQVTYIAEVCDPVQGVPYQMENGALVADFVTPAYYKVSGSSGPFAHHAALPGPLSIPPLGYITYFDITNQWFQARNFGGGVQFIQGPVGGGPPPDVCAREFAHGIAEFQDRPRPFVTPEQVAKQRLYEEHDALARRRQAETLLAGSDVLRSLFAVETRSGSGRPARRNATRRRT